MSVLPKDAPRSPVAADVDAPHSEGCAPSSPVRAQLTSAAGSGERRADGDVEERERVFETKDLQRVLIARRDELKLLPPRPAAFMAQPAQYEPYVYSAESELALLGYRAEWHAWKAHKAAKARTVMLPYNTDTQFPFRLLKLTETWPRYPTLEWGCFDHAAPAFGAILLRGGRPTAHAFTGADTERNDRELRERDYLDDVLLGSARVRVRVPPACARSLSHVRPRRVR